MNKGSNSRYLILDTEGSPYLYLEGKEMRRVRRTSGGDSIEDKRTRTALLI